MSVGSCAVRCSPRVSVGSSLASVETKKFPGLSNHLITAFEFDTDNNCFVLTRSALFMISSNGTKGLVCGDDSEELGFSDGAGIQARFDCPSHMQLLSGKRLLVSDWNNHALRMVFLETGIVQTIVGTGEPGISADGVEDETSQLNQPGGLAKDSNGIVYCADSQNNRIMKLEIPDDWPTTKVSMTVLSGCGNAGHVDGDRETSEFNMPIGLRLDGDNNLVVADAYNRAIRYVCSSCGQSKTLSGNDIDSVEFRDGEANNARFAYPCEIAVDANNNFIIVDQYNHCLRLMKQSGLPYINVGHDHPESDYPSVVTIAGGGNIFGHNDIPSELQSVDGLGVNARFYLPFHISFDNTGKLWVLSADNHGEARIVTSLNENSFIAKGLHNTLIL